MQIPTIQFTQGSRKLFLAALPISLFDPDKNLVKVDHFDARTQSGYQRKPSSARAKDFARYIVKARGISPTAILLNVRESIGDFKPIHGTFGILDLPEGTVLWVVDGQHRIEGFEEVITSDRNASFSGFHVPVVIMSENSEYEEAKQFIIVNKTQKGVKADLAERFIAKMVRREGPQDLDNLPRATTRDIEWRPRATDLVDKLNNTNPEEPSDEFYGNPWAGKIQLPNEPKGSTVVSQKSFEDSLKPVLNSDSFRAYNTDELALLLVRYWKALNAVCPEAFQTPRDYVTQRTTGVFVLHRVLPRVITLAARNGARLTTERLREIVQKMGEGATDLFWSTSGPAGQMGSSQKAIGILSTRLIDFLEEGCSEEITHGKHFSL